MRRFGNVETLEESLTLTLTMRYILTIFTNRDVPFIRQLLGTGYSMLILILKMNSQVCPYIGGS